MVVKAYLAPVTSVKKNQYSPRSDAGTQIALVLAEWFLSMAQQFAWHIFSGIITWLMGKQMSNDTNAAHLHFTIRVMYVHL